jgi:hypothetical protein
MTVIPSARIFDFHADTLAYPNELVWEYHFDAATGREWTEKRSPPPTYAHRCFVVVRSVRQFFYQARFDPQAAPLEDAEYYRRIQAVTRRSPRETTSASRIQFPGFADLRQFSRARPGLLKAACGGAWQSYVQRGNWRMIMPFSRDGQERMAGQLRGAIAEGRLPIVHVATFPSLTINHVLLLFGCAESADALEFQACDPNICNHPVTLRFDRRSRWFQFPRTHYFAGGNVNAYEIYCGAFL